MRKRMKKLGVYLMTAVLMLSCISVEGTTVKAQGMSVSSSDPIGYLLNRYQVVVSGDITNTTQDAEGNWSTDTQCSAHLMGAVLIGGALNSGNSIGDASVAPSYINNLIGVQPWGRGYENKTNPYEEHGSPFINPSYVYYDTISDTLNSTVQSNDQLRSRYVQNVGYADVANAVAQAATQSQALATAATPLTVENGVLEVDFTDGGANYSVDSAALSGATIKLYFKNIDDLTDELCTLSITGTTEFNYDKVEIYVNGTKQDTNAVLEGMTPDTTLTEMGIETKELNLSGMNLLFNFPDMTSLTFSSSGVAGHIVAPKADVTISTGNFEGGIIAKAFHTESAQGHFYPMTKTITYTTAPTADVTFSKTSAASTGELAGATITLSTTDADLTEVTKDATSGGTITERTATSITWKSTTSAMILENLPVGTYTMTEVTAPAGYKTAEKISFSINDEGKVLDENGQEIKDNKITMVDAPKAGSIVLTGTKVVTGDDAASGTYSFVVKEGNVQVSKGSVTTAKTAGATITFDEISYGPKDIGEHEYTITEVIPATVPEGFVYDKTAKTVTVVVKDTTGDSLSAEVKAGSDAITFTNEYVTVSKTVTKVWADDNDIANKRPASVAVQLKADGINKGTPVVLNTGNTWTYTWSDLPKTNTQGEEIVYTVDELSVPDGYSKKVTTAANGNVTITNTYPAVPVVKTDVTFSKTDAASTGELAGATITLSTNDADLSDVTKDAASGGTIKSQTAAKITWESTTSAMVLKDLPEGTYTMTEVTAPAGYKKAEVITFTIDSQGDVYQGSTKVSSKKIVMKDAPEEGSITFSVTKDITGDVPPTETFKFILADKNGNTVEEGTVTGEGKYTFAPITFKGPESIGEYTYKITEKAGTTEGMTYDTAVKTIVVKVADGNEKLDVSVTSGSKDVVITNTYTKPVIPLTATGTFSKKAVSADGNELAGATMQLIYSGSNDLSNVTYTGGSNVTVAANNMSISWTSTTTPVKLSGLPEGEYTFHEEGAPKGYKYATDIAFKVAADGKIYQKISDSVYSTTASTILTMVDEAKAGSIYLPGTKVVEGTGAPSETYQFVVKEGTKQVATGSISGAGKFTFSKIEYGPTDIGEHTYTITETAGSTEGMTYDNTEVTIKVTVTETENALSATITSGKDAIKFTNTYTAPTPTVTTVDKTIKKVWADVNDTDKLRPESVELAILADGVKTGKTVILNASNNWEAKVEKLPTTNASGTAIVYTIEETSVPAGYTVTYSSSGDVLTATNTHTPTSKDAPATGGLKITVVDEKTNDPVPGATVQVKYPDGTVETVKTDEKGQITYPQEPGIPTGDYEITVTEVPDGYTVTTGETGKATVVENKVAEHIAKIKTATGGLKITVVDEKTNDPVPGATVQVKYPDGTVETKTTDENGEIIYPQDPGVPTGDYEVTVTEVPDGYTVTTGETAKVTVEKNAVAEHVAKVDSAEDSTSEEEEEEEDSDEDSDEITDDDSNEEQDSDATAKTGDNSPIKPVAAIMLLALALFVVLLFIRRKNA